MKKILTLFCVFVLFSLTLNSCKKCSKENNPEDGNSNTDQALPQDTQAQDSDGSKNQGNQSATNTTADLVKRLIAAESEIKQKHDTICNHKNKVERLGQDAVKNSMTAAHTICGWDKVHGTLLNMQEETRKLYKIRDDINTIFDDAKNAAQANATVSDVKDRLASLEKARDMAFEAIKQMTRLTIAEWESLSKRWAGHATTDLAIRKINFWSLTAMSMYGIAAKSYALAALAVSWMTAAGVGDQDSHIAKSKEAFGKAKYLYNTKASENPKWSKQFDDLVNGVKLTLPAVDWDSVPPVEVHF
jgi:hypothetical protein